MADGSPSETDALGAQARTVLLRAAVVIAGYIVYAALAMTMPTSDPGGADPMPHHEQAGDGVRVWLAHNCQSCHSLYGLGGHTGPDLTNVAERRLPGYVEAVVGTGLPGMPPIALDDHDAAALAAFLGQVSATGVYPPKHLRGPVFGERR